MSLTTMTEEIKICYVSRPDRIYVVRYWVFNPQLEQ